MISINYSTIIFNRRLENSNNRVVHCYICFICYSSDIDHSNNRLVIVLTNNELLFHHCCYHVIAICVQRKRRCGRYTPRGILYTHLFVCNCTVISCRSYGTRLRGINIIINNYNHYRIIIYNRWSLYPTENHNHLMVMRYNYLLNINLLMNVSCY